MIRPNLIRKIVLACAFVPVSLMASSSTVEAARPAPCVAPASGAEAGARTCPCGGVCEYSRYSTTCCTPGYRCYYPV